MLASIVLYFAHTEALLTIYYPLLVGACGIVRPTVNLNISAGLLKFYWSPLDSECSTVQYRIMSDCGNCSRYITDEISATCSELQLSETATNCTFSVQGMTRGFNGTQSNSTSVTLKGK